MARRYLILLCFIALCDGAMHAQGNTVNLSAGVSNSFRYLHTKESDLEFIIGVSNAMEMPDLRLGVEATYSHKISKKGFLSAGLSYQQLGYVLNDVDELRWGSEFINGEYINDPALPDALKMIQKSNFILIPISYRHVFGENSRMKPFVLLGMSPALYLNRTIISKTDITPVQKESPAISSPRMHIFTSLAVGLDLKISESLSVFTQANFLYQINSLFGQGPVKEHSTSLGLNLGVRKALGKKPKESLSE